MKRVATLLVVLLLPVLARADGNYRERKRALEDEFAPRYMKVAVGAKNRRDGPLARAAYQRAESLNPGDDAVIAFDPEVRGKPGWLDRRKVKKLEKEYADLRAEEAKRRLELAEWCDDEALIDESVAEAVQALTLDPGPVTFDERGILSTPGLGPLPETLSLAVLEEHEVFAGKVLPRSKLPAKVSWSSGWKLSTRHFVIRTNVSGRICRLAGRALEAAREIYRDMSGFDVEKKMTIYVVASRTQYEGLIERMGEGKPEAGNVGRCKGDFCAVDGTKSDRQIVSTVIHECAHGYLNLGIAAKTGKEGASMPVWFHEGFATYCAGYGPGSLSYDHGVVLPRVARDEPLAHFREMVEKGEAMPMAKFLATEHGDAAFYYQAFAFAWFWYEMEDPDLKARYEEAVTAMENAALGADRTKRGTGIFLKEIGMTPAELQKRFFAWVRALTFDPAGASEPVSSH